MSGNLMEAVRLLENGKYTCVLSDGNVTYTSTERGVQPLADWLSSDTNLHGFSAADKVVGKAAAFLYILAGVKEVYAPVMSRAAIRVLEQHGIEALYKTQAEVIINRAGTGMCPMEQAVKEIEDPEQAFLAIEQKLKNMTNLKL